jgi:hypothetical protein
LKNSRFLKYNIICVEVAMVRLQYGLDFFLSCPLSKISYVIQWESFFVFIRALICCVVDKLKGHLVLMLAILMLVIVPLGLVDLTYGALTLT